MSDVNALHLIDVLKTQRNAAQDEIAMTAAQGLGYLEEIKILTGELESARAEIESLRADSERAVREVDDWRERCADANLNAAEILQKAYRVVPDDLTAIRQALNEDEWDAGEYEEDHLRKMVGSVVRGLNATRGAVEIK